MTKREMFNLIATVNADNAEIVDFCSKEIALLDKRNDSRANYVTKNQRENEEICSTIADVLSRQTAEVSVSDLLAEKELSTYSNQKMSSLLNKMVRDGKVSKRYEKKKALFCLR